MKIDWQRDLGSPTQNGFFSIEEINMVYISQSDIAKADRLGECVEVELIVLFGSRDLPTIYRLGEFSVVH